MPKKVNVLIDTTPAGNEHAVRGIGMYTRKLVEHLADAFGVQVYASPSEVKEGPLDVIHYPYFDFFFSTLPLRRAKPTVVTVHDVIPLVFPEHYPPGIKGKLKLVKQKVALKSVEAILTDSEASKKDITKHLDISPDKIHVVYLAANPDLLPQPETVQEEVRARYKLPAKYVLYVGDINYNKNLPQLIKSIKFLPEDISLVCVGKNFVEQDIPEWQWIETQMALSNVTDRVHFVPTIGTDATRDLAALYSAAEAYIQPSLYEGFGLPVLEAMQCKTPVVAAKNSSLLEVGGEHAVFVETDAEDIARGIEEVLRWTKTKRQQWIRAAYKWSQKFSWEQTAKETARVYRQAVEEK